MARTLRQRVDSGWLEVERNAAQARVGAACAAELVEVWPRQQGKPPWRRQTRRGEVTRRSGDRSLQVASRTRRPAVGGAGSEQEPVRDAAAARCAEVGDCGGSGCGR
ncbi:hypothetical protein ZWY2020_022991 [Hordeum vulgare]|nr:hypothetical protein ZWY2020_022991 [Hordeum vulgare]